MSQHAILSPSGASRWMECASAPAMELGLVDKGSIYSSEGTAAHFLASTVLENPELNAESFADKNIFVNVAGDVNFDFTSGMDPGNYDGFSIFNCQALAPEVQIYVDYVRALLDSIPNSMLFVEVALPLSHLTNEAGAQGTADAVIVAPAEIHVVDLKFGKGEKVSAVKNKQLLIYASSAVKEFSYIVPDISKIVLHISQPRIDAVPETYELNMEEMLAFEAEVKAKAERASMILAETKIGISPSSFSPGDACRWCKAKMQLKCDAAIKFAVETLADDFVDLNKPLEPQLEHAKTMTFDKYRMANLLDALPLIEDLCGIIKAQAQAQLMRGEEIPRYKLVKGRKGARQWSSEETAQAVMEKMRLKREVMYTFKLVTPAGAEQLAKAGTLGAIQWARLCELITQAEGSPTVVKATDKRPAIDVQPLQDDFKE